jgi:P-type Cu2+ transporter
MSCCAGPIVADYATASTTAARIALRENLQHSANKLANGLEVYTLSVPSIHCGNCIATIERNLAKLGGVSAVRANLTLRRVSVTIDRNKISALQIVDALEDLGFPAHPLSVEDSAKRDPQFKALLRALAISGFAAANIMLLSIAVWNGAEGATRDLFHFVSALIAIPAVAIGGIPFFSSALAALRKRRVNMDVPISLGVLLATGMSLYESLLGGGHAYFDAAVSLLFFLLIGRTLEFMMRAKARAAAEQLAQLSAKGGFVVGDDGETIYLPLAALMPGMTIRVAAGERFPVDGLVMAGESDADRSLVTGESDPLLLRAGVSVEAGTLNLTGAVDMRATRAAKDSFLAEISNMMAAAEKGRGTYERIADRMARIYAPVVHVLAATSFAGWMIYTGGDWHQSITVAIAVLIITCPCALGLAVPVAHVIAAGRLFANGILVKDGSGLERLSSITHAVFDKTGTLTTGQPIVTQCNIPAGQHRARAKALASRSVHPAARALAMHLQDSVTTAFDSLHEVPGHGVEAVHQGKCVRLGRQDWVAQIARPYAEPDQRSGVAFAVEGDAMFFTSLSETLRDGARDMISTLTTRGVAVSILSGDATSQVGQIAAQVGIKIFAASLQPGEKLHHLQTMREHGASILMVGDGLNDAPALAAANVSMAPASASDVGRMAADFVFTRPSLESVSFAHEAAQKTARIVRQNFALAILYNVFAVPLAMTGQLNPLIAAIAMSSSSIIVVANSFRLYRLNIRKNQVVGGAANISSKLQEAGT